MPGLFVCFRGAQPNQYLKANIANIASQEIRSPRARTVKEMRGGAMSHVPSQSEFRVLVPFSSVSNSYIGTYRTVHILVPMICLQAKVPYLRSDLSLPQSHVWWPCLPSLRSHLYLIPRLLLLETSPTAYRTSPMCSCSACALICQQLSTVMIHSSYSP